MAPVMRNPPLYSLRDLDTWVTLSHVLDADEIMTLERAAIETTRQQADARQGR